MLSTNPYMCYMKFLVSGLKGLVTYALGFDKISTVERDRRRMICQFCPHRTPRKLKWSRCTQCGCWIYAKTSVGVEGCKLGEWEQI